MRTFIAVRISSPLQKTIYNALENFRQDPKLEKIRWAPMENFHVTVQFLGKTNNDNIQKLTGPLINQLSRFSSFKSTLNRLHFFPSDTNAHAVIVDFENAQPWIELASSITQITTELGYQSQKRPFSPHMTVGRIKNNKIKYDFGECDFSSEEVDVNSVAIIKSTQGDGQMIYEDLERISLDG